jgi:hypothetical protein
MPAFGVPDSVHLSGSATAIVHMPWPLEREGTGRAVAAAAEGGSTLKGFASVIRNTSTSPKLTGPGSSSDAVQTRSHPPSELDRAFSTYAPARQTVPYHLPPPPPPHSHRLPPPPLPAPPQAVISHQQVFVANISSHPHSTPSSSLSFATEQVMYANLQLQQLSTRKRSLAVRTRTISANDVRCYSPLYRRRNARPLCLHFTRPDVLVPTGDLPACADAATIRVHG